jgi:diaminopimelate decarboxylase
MDVVSGGEYLRAKAAGVPGERIVFSGRRQDGREMRMALEGGIRQFNVESEPELEVAVAGRVLHGENRADHRAREPGRGCAHP